MRMYSTGTLSHLISLQGLVLGTWNRVIIQHSLRYLQFVSGIGSNGDVTQYHRL